MLGLAPGLVVGAQCVGVPTGRDPARCSDAVGGIPGRRVGLELGHHERQFVGQAVPGRPTQQVPRAPDVQRVMVVGHGDHEGADEGQLAPVEGVGHHRLQLALHPGARRRQGLGHAQRAPVLRAVHQRAQGVLQHLVAHGIGLADQQFGAAGQLLAPVHRQPQGSQHVFAVQRRLAHEQAAGVEVALQVALVDAGHLLRHRGHHGLRVVHPRQAQHDAGDVPVLFAQHRLGSGLRLGVGPGRCQRLCLVDVLAGAAWRMHEHRAGVQELAHLEALQRAQQTPRAVHVDRLVQGVVFAREVEVGGQVHDTGDARAVSVAKRVQCRIHRLVRPEVHGKDREAVVGPLPPLALRPGLAIEADDAVAVGQGLRDRPAEIARSTRHQDDRSVIGSGHGRDLIGSRCPSRSCAAKPLRGCRPPAMRAARRGRSARPAAVCRPPAAARG